MHKLLRLIDANLNRSREGIRVCEDIARFVLNDKRITRSFKSLKLESRYSKVKKGNFDLSHEINLISPTLIKIKMVIGYKNVTQKIFFFKSKIIKNHQGGQK